MPQVTLSVRGMNPKPWGSHEWDWRAKVAEEGRRARLKMAEECLTPKPPLSVELVFHMDRRGHKGADLDNLAKPVLDTLFKSRQAQVKDLSLTGALFDLDDDRVFKLTLEKKLAPSEPEEGVDVTITWV